MWLVAACWREVHRLSCKNESRLKSGMEEVLEWEEVGEMCGGRGAWMAGVLVRVSLGPHEPFRPHVLPVRSIHSSQYESTL